MTLGAAALATNRIKLGTGIAVALSRHPVVTANEAADVDELSHGRMILGLGTGAEPILQAVYDTELTHPIPRMREYIEAMRTVWGAVDSSAPASYSGTYYKLQLGGFHRPLVRKRIPIYLAGVKPKIIQLAGELAEGHVGYFYSPRYLKEVVHPNLAIGAKRAGRDVAEVDVSSFMVCSVSKDRKEALRRARIQMGYYAGLVGGFCHWHGLEKEQRAIFESFMKEGPQALERTDEKLVQAFSIYGTPDECRRQLASFEGILPLSVLHTPYIDPLTAEESEDALRGIVETFGQ